MHFVDIFRVESKGREYIAEPRGDVVHGVGRELDSVAPERDRHPGDIDQGAVAQQPAQARYGRVHVLVLKLLVEGNRSRAHVTGELLGKLHRRPLELQVVGGRDDAQADAEQVAQHVEL